MQVQCYLPLLQLGSELNDFNNGVCPVMKTATAETNPDAGLVNTANIVLISLSVLAEDNKMLMMTICQ